MKKRTIRIILLVMLLTFALSVQAFAIAPQESALISEYAGVLFENSDGELAVNFAIVGTKVLCKIGSSSVIVQEREIGTTKWSTTTTLNPKDCPELQIPNDSFYRPTISCGVARELGYEYRAVITFYAEDEKSFDTKIYKTSVI